MHIVKEPAGTSRFIRKSNKENSYKFSKFRIKQADFLHMRDRSVTFIGLRIIKEEEFGLSRFGLSGRYLNLKIVHGLCLKLVDPVLCVQGEGRDKRSPNRRTRNRTRTHTYGNAVYELGGALLQGVPGDAAGPGGAGRARGGTLLRLVGPDLTQHALTPSVHQLVTRLTAVCKRVIHFSR